MARFLLESPHTPEECDGEIDSILAFSKELFNRIDWGCKAGEHTGWAVVEAQDEKTARMLLPTFLRQKAHVVHLNKFTVEEVQSWHVGH